MPIVKIDKNRPKFYLYPVNNNRTAWRPIGLPVILVIPHSRDPSGAEVSDSSLLNMKIYVENVPQSAYIAGHDHQLLNGQLRSPDNELFAINISQSELYENGIDLKNLQFYNRQNDPIEYSDAQSGDKFDYITQTGVVDQIEYLNGANYYDLSKFQLDVEELPPDNYNIVYQGEYYNRILSKNDKQDFLCIDGNSTSLALFKFGFQHPGQVLEEFYRLTTNFIFSTNKKSDDPVIQLYRPFTDILQDVMDEQSLLEKVNWVYDAPAEVIPYLSALLGWDLPYFPNSLDTLRKAVLRRTVEFQNLKGSRRSIINIFRLFGFEVLISNLWWSSDGKRLIRPGELLEDYYKDEQIDIQSNFQIDLAINDLSLDKFKQIKIPLLYRPQITAGLDNFVALRDGGDITITSYLVEKESSAYAVLKQLSENIYDNIDTFGQIASCQVDEDGFITSATIEDAIYNLPIVGTSSILYSGKMGEQNKQVFRGQIPPVLNENIIFNRESNEITLFLNGYLNTNEDYRIFTFVLYKKLDLLIPDDIKDLQSNRFELQVLTESLKEFADPTTLDFAIEFLYRLKAFHSLLHLIRTRIELSETYEVTDLLIGGDYEQRYDTDIGRLQVPPAITPTGLTGTNDCNQLDPESLGYKDEDLILRTRKLDNLEEEYESYARLDNRLTDNNDSTTRIGINEPTETESEKSYFNQYGQDRIIVDDDIISKSNEYHPNPNSGLTPKLSIEAGIFDGSSNRASTNSNTGLFGSFNTELNISPPAITQLDGIQDYKYKGRVRDHILYRINADLSESYNNNPCSLTFGKGCYYSYPAFPVNIVPGTIAPSQGSYSQKWLLSGKASTYNVKHFDNGIQAKFLNNRLNDRNRSLLSKLYGNYDSPNDETIHYVNTAFDADQRSYLAISRPSLDIVKSTLHLPGCRFMMMNQLTTDYISNEYKARPWDDRHSSYCRPNTPDFLNNIKVVATDGNEYLMFDDIEYSIIGNGLIPDINSFDDHILLTDHNFKENDVIHSVFMTNAVSNPAVTLECVNAALNSIEIEVPIFNSASLCNTTSYVDYIDGYPAANGYQSYTDTEVYQYEEVLAGLGLDVSINNNNNQYLYTFGSGILIEKGSRFDCECLKYQDCTETEDLSCSLEYYKDGDWNPDQISMTANMVCNEVINTATIFMNGFIPTSLEIL